MVSRTTDLGSKVKIEFSKPVVAWLYLFLFLNVILVTASIVIFNRFMNYLTDM